MTLAWWWPAEDRLNEVLISNAVAHSPAVALAVHQPMVLLRRHHSRPIGAEEAEAVDESYLLRLLQEPVGDGAQVVLIEGDSGTGKSHIVRWLELQLQRLPGSDRRVLLSVERGARLRDIVRALCARPELSGDEYAELRRRIAHAQDPVEPREAARSLLLNLAVICERRAEQAAHRAETGATLAELEILQKRWGTPAQLPYVLVHPALQDYFVADGGVARRLVEHIDAKGDPLEARARPEFVDADLLVDVPDEISDPRAAQVLNRLGDPLARREAAAVLNEALDEAKRSSLRLNAGDVGEVFKAIRSVLLKENKELVLLVEDFADMSGIQTEILEAARLEGQVNGVPVRCTLRTVLAYTAGYLDRDRTTIRSRAQYVYDVPTNHWNEREVLERASRLIAYYLHAARFGRTELDAAMRDSTSDDWMPRHPDIDENLRRTLDAFGHVDGVPLFPFTPRVIARVLRDIYGGKGQSVMFVPRDIVRDIMPRILEHRSAFLQRTFPTEAFPVDGAALLSESEAAWLNQAPLSAPVRKRVERFFLYWGRNPGAAQAFGLPLDGLMDDWGPDEAESGVARRVTATRGVTMEAVPGTRPAASFIPPAPAAVDSFEPARSMFDAWRAGSPIEEISQRRNIREAVDASIRPSLAWAWRPRRDKQLDRWKGWHEFIAIDGVRMANPYDAPVWSLINPTERADKGLNPTIASELVAVVGAQQLESWDVDGVESHLAAHLAFVDRHRAAVEKHLLGTFHLRPLDALAFFVRALAWTGAVLGVPNAGSHDSEKFIAALFAPPPRDPPIGRAAEVPWMKDVVGPIHSLRAQLRTFVEEEIGAWQGDRGREAHGLDVARLVQFVPERGSQVPHLPLPPAFPRARSTEDVQSIVRVAETFSTLDKISSEEIDRRRKCAAYIRAQLGDHRDLKELATALEVLEAELRGASALNESRSQTLSTVVPRLKHVAVVGPLESVDRLAPRDASLWERVVSLARGDEWVVSLDELEKALRGVDGLLAPLERQSSDADPRDPFDEALAAHIEWLDTAVRALDLLTAPAEEAEGVPA